MCYPIYINGKREKIRKEIKKEGHTLLNVSFSILGEIIQIPYFPLLRSHNQKYQTYKPPYFAQTNGMKFSPDKATL